MSSPDLEGWQDAARRFEAAGAQILELNFCCPNMSFNVDVSTRESKEARPSSGASMGQDENSVRLVIEKIREVNEAPDHRQDHSRRRPDCGGFQGSPMRPALRRSAVSPTVLESLPLTSGTIRSRFTTFRAKTRWVVFPALDQAPRPKGCL